MKWDTQYPLEDNNENVLTARTLDYGRIQDIPKALLQLLKNATYLFITIGGTMDGFLLAGKH